MADDVNLATPTGVVAADDIGSKLYQKVKIGWGADNTWNETADTTGKEIPVKIASSQMGTLGQTTMAGSVPVTIASNQTAQSVTQTAGELHIGEFGGKTAVRAVTLSTDTAVYASGDLIADAQIIDGFFRKTDGTGLINSITIIDEDNQGAAINILFMSTSTSLGTENAAPSISDANLTAGLQGIVAVATTDYITMGASNQKIACIRNIGLPVIAASGTDDIYIGIVNGTGTPTYTASGLEMRIGVLLD